MNVNDNKTSARDFSLEIIKPNVSFTHKTFTFSDLSTRNCSIHLQSQSTNSSKSTCGGLQIVFSTMLVKLKWQETVIIGRRNEEGYGSGKLFFKTTIGDDVIHLEVCAKDRYRGHSTRATTPDSGYKVLQPRDNI